MSRTPPELLCPTCGKGTYQSFTRAKKGARTQRRLRDMRLRPYRCPDRHGWHLTSEPTPKRPKKEINAQ
ncbi:hypothetical protein [Phytoactinopolyspora limicola]|uniref:hypothetical protein n=1 Tax=Phytoactinopolyspora limicola TaxID=2715536 RepID=UPI0014076FD3|nr:hypothetical protein [Phytoactinopolyspora limicola]